MARRPPVIDPTKNVLTLVKKGLNTEKALRRAGDKEQARLTSLERRHRKELAKVENGARIARELAESRRINALLADKDANVALALGKQEAQALAQDKRIAVLEQNQYSGAGGTAAVDKAQGRSAVTVNQLIATGVLLIAVLTWLHSLKVI